MTHRPIRVFMLDLLATVPYYTAYLSKALLKENVDLSVGSVSYYLDRTCFSSRGITNHPGLLDIVSRFSLPRVVRRPLKLLEALINLTALAMQFFISPPEILHVQFLPMLTWPTPFDLWFTLFCRKRGSIIVLTVHDLLPHDTGNAHEARFKLLYHSVDQIICHSDHIRSRLANEFHVAPESVTVIPHGPFFYDLDDSDISDTHPALPKQTHAVCVLCQGIIHPYKGVDLLLDAWQKVEAIGGGHRLIIAGTGHAELLDELRQKAASLDLKSAMFDFRFVTIAELLNLYRQADIVVYPYRAITTSGSLATGLALSKVIVASDLPVFREILTNRQNAILIDPRNPEGLAAALIELINDSSLRRRISVNVTAMNFGDASWDLIAGQTVQVYEEALLRNPR